MRQAIKDSDRIVSLCWIALAFLILLALLSGGCASMPPGQKAMIAAVSADAASTAYALKFDDGFSEVGIAGGLGSDDSVLLGVVMIDLGLILAVDRLHARWPDWQGWPSVFWAITAVKGSAAAANISTIENR